ncbi:MAG: thymidine kinase [Acholeplasmataceae bacterium]|jgi:thymidine kinase
MYHSYKNGFIEVVCGPMFAGKTEELIRRIKRLQYAKQNILVFNPKLDNRYSQSELVSHSNMRTQAYFIEKSTDAYNYIKEDTDAVVFDEAQFFDMDIVEVADDLADKGLRVIIGGLDRNFRGEPFGPMPFLLAKAEFVTKLTAICVKTGEPATRTQRIINGEPADYNSEVILVSGHDYYEARSRHAHEVPNKPKYEPQK